MKTMMSRKYSLIAFLVIALKGKSALFAQNYQPTFDNDFRTQLVDSFFQNQLQTLHIPGLSLAVVADGKIIYTKGYGFANLEHQIPSKPETNYLIASVTKSITAVALMMLWEEGKFTLGDSIGQYLGALPAHWNQLTMRQLLNHSSRIPTNARLNDEAVEPSYGLGFGLTPYLGQWRVGHTGQATGFSSSLTRFIDMNLSVIIFTNTNHPEEFSVLKLSNEIAAFYL
jgi:hypothetical protein